MPGIMTSSTTRSGRCSRARRQASSPSDAWITSSFGSLMVRRWRATSSNIDGSSSATRTSGGGVVMRVLSKDAGVWVKRLAHAKREERALFVLEFRRNLRRGLDELLRGVHVL